MDFYEILACESGLSQKDGISLASRYSKCVNKVINYASAEDKDKRAEGDYVTLFANYSLISSKETKKAMANCLRDELITFTENKRCLRVFVAGLGNARLTADCLGARVCDKIILFRGDGELYCKAVGVYSDTGIESAYTVKGIADMLMPDLVIAVDTLATNKPERIGRVVQLTNSGITPGKAVNNARVAITDKQLGCKVLAMGATLVAYAKNVFENKQELSELHLVPKEIDILEEHFSDVIASAINMAFCKVKYQNSIKLGSSYTF